MGCPGPERSLQLALPLKDAGWQGGSRSKGAGEAALRSLGPTEPWGSQEHLHRWLREGRGRAGPQAPTFSPLSSVTVACFRLQVHLPGHTEGETDLEKETGLKSHRPAPGLHVQGCSQCVVAANIRYLHCLRGPF